LELLGVREKSVENNIKCLEASSRKEHEEEPKKKVSSHSEMKLRVSGSERERG